ncbi:MAG: RNase A-like domain-containing protein [Alphaproteobacteria bacterium]
MLAESGTEVVYLLRKEFKRWNLDGVTHVYEKHINVSDQDLINRVLDPFEPNKASRYYNEEVALKEIYAQTNTQQFNNLYARAQLINPALPNPNVADVFQATQAVGKGYKKVNGVIVEVDNINQINIVLRKTSDNRIIIYTSYPQI